MGFCHSLLNLFKGGWGYLQNLYLCLLFFNILVKSGLLVNFNFFFEGGVRLRYRLTKMFFYYYF